MDLRVAEEANAIVGVLALEPTRETPDGSAGLLLHGVHVHPDHQGTGLGRELVAAALEQVRTEDASGLLVKAQRQARGFFEQLGFRLLPVEDPARDYPYRYWLDA
jgi:N-acetylglutamate synthase-like GNAT family acetyltransferase